MAQAAAPNGGAVGSSVASTSVRAGESSDGSNLNGDWIVPGLIFAGVLIILATIIFEGDDPDSP
jgi:hypothetical protein